MAKQLFTHRGFGNVALFYLVVGLGSVLSGCALLYPERSTPIRGLVSEDRYEPPPPRDVLFVAIKAARIPPKTRDGRSWDKMGGSAPDPYAILFVNEQEILRTVVVANSLRPTWPNPSPANIRIPSKAKVRLEVWDDNALVSHPICSQGIRDIQDAASVGQIEIACDSGASVILVVEPPKARLGIGLYYEVRGKTAVVTRVIEASAAGRAGLQVGDQILSVAGRRVSAMESGELEGIFSTQSGAGFAIEVRSPSGEVRKAKVADEPMYPVKGEGIELLFE